MAKTKILLGLDYPLMAKAIENGLEKIGFEVCSICSTSAEAYHKILENKPNISILAISSPDMNALKVMKKLSEANIQTNIIVKTSLPGLGLYQYALSMGAKGYLLKTDSIEEFEKCVELVAKGETYFGESLESRLKPDNQMGNYEKLANLSVAELKVLNMISNNMSTKQIAEEIFIATKSVNNHRSNITKKLNLKPEQSSLKLWALEHKVMLGTML